MRYWERADDAWIDRLIARRRVIVGSNLEPGRRFGRHRERLFTALFLGPVIVGIGARKYR